MGSRPGGEKIVTEEHPVILSGYTGSGADYAGKSQTGTLVAYSVNQRQLFTAFKFSKKSM